MSGTLVIKEKIAWMPAGWVYDGVLELIAEAVDDRHPELRRFLTEARTDYRGYGDVRKLSSEEFSMLLAAAGQAYSEAAAAGPSSFHDPKGYGPFVKHFGALIELLRADPRAALSQNTG